MTRGFGRFLRQNTIALLALFIALGGTTFAAANALPRNSVGTRQLKNNAVTSPKIKNNQVTGADVRESSLGTVPSATNASHATSADSATSATSASNSAALNGEGPSVYLDRFAQGAPGFGPFAVPQGVTTEIVPPFSITIPSGVNAVSILGRTTLAGSAGATTWIIWFQEDAACTTDPSPGFDFRPFGRLQAAGDQQTLNQTQILGVTAGVHTFRLCALSGTTAASAFNPVLSVQTVPRGPTGASRPLGRQGSAHSTGSSANPTVAR